MLTNRYVAAGKEVRRLRLRQGLTHESLAALAKVSTKTVQRIENGTGHEHRGSTYRKLAGPLGVPPAHLLDIIFGDVEIPDHEAELEALAEELGVDDQPDDERESDTG